MARVLLVGDKRMTADWVGRKLIVASFLYYQLDEPGMSDARYDRMSNFVADYFDELEWERKWAFRFDPESTRSTGSHFRFTTLAAGAALNRYKYITGISLGWHPDMEWRERNRDGCRYITLSALKPVPLTASEPRRPIRPKKLERRRPRVPDLFG